jgi:hypothetical protein
MKTTILKSVIAVLVALFSLNVNSQTTIIIDGVNYSYYTNNYPYATAVGTPDLMGEVTIPSTIYTPHGIRKVNSIADGAFKNNTNLKSITIPGSLNSIGENAFLGCTNLETVYISDLAKWCTIQYDYDNPSNPLEYAQHLILNGEEVTDLVIPTTITVVSSRAFAGYKSLKSLTIPNNVTTIENYAFQGCSNLTSIIIEDGENTLYVNKGRIGVTLDHLYWGRGIHRSESGWPFGLAPNASITINSSNAISPIASFSTYAYDNSVEKIGEIILGDAITSIPEYAFSRCTGLTSIIIPNNVVSIGNFAVSSSPNLSTVDMPDNIVEMGYKAFNSATKLNVNKGTKTLLTCWKPAINPINPFWEKWHYTLYDKNTGDELLPPSFNVKTTQTTASVKIENWDDGFTYLYNNEETTKKEFKYTKLKPDTKQDLTLIVSKDDVQYDISGSFTTQSLLPRIEEMTQTASSISATGAYTEDDAKVVGHSIQIADNEVVDGNHVYASGLNPGRKYTVKYNIVVDYGGEETATYTGTRDIYTEVLEAKMEQPKVVSEGNVIVSASTNLDEEETNVGFEWRCTDWTKEFPSNTGTAYLYDGVIEGYIKNLNTDKLWKCRPYYLSDSGTYHYGDWMGVDPTNTSYFEPTVHTYSKVTIKGNTALVRGYALSGTDEVKVQGFKYWRTRGGGGYLKKVVAVPSDALTVELNNKLQTLTTTLSNLEYDSEYCCVAFVTTTDGNTFYGEEQKFITGEAPSEIECVETESDTDESLIEVARYNVNGQKIDAPQKGVNIIRYSDGTTKSVYVK